MTDGMQDREKAFENKFKHDEELKFKINVRGVKMFGLWAAGHMGLEGAEADEYAKAVVEHDFNEPGLQDVIRKVSEDLSAKGISFTDYRLEEELFGFFDKAHADLTRTS